MDGQTLANTGLALAHVPNALKDAAEERKIAAGDMLFRLGDRPRHIFYVVEGEIRLFRHARNGQEIILQRSRAGFVAEASLDVPAYHCDALAPVAAALVCFPIREFNIALAEDKAFHREWSAHLAREVRKLRAQCERLNLHTAAERIVHYLEAEGIDGAVTLSQTRSAWAAGLGLSHEALYRTLRRMQAEGALEIEGKKISIGRVRRDGGRPL